MKHLFYYIFLICILVASCKNGKKDANVNITSVAQDTASLEQKEEAEPLIRCPDVIYTEDIVVDTIIHNFHISFVVKNNNSIIYYRNIDSDGDSVKYNYADMSAFLTLKFEDKTLIKNQEINKYTFKSYIPKETIESYELVSFTIKKVNDHEILFDAFFCMPDTDVCYPMEVLISKNGKVVLRENETFYDSTDE